MKRVFVLLLFFSRSALAGDVTSGRFDPGTPYEPFLEHANASRMYVQQVPRGAGKTVSIDLPVTGGGELVVWSRANMALQALAGRKPCVDSEDFVIDDTAAAEVGVAAGRHYVRRVQDAEAGLYRLEVEMSVGDARGVIVAVSEPQSAVILTTSVTPLSRQPKDTIFLRAFLSNDGSPITKARVIARLASPTGNVSALDGFQLIEKEPGKYEFSLPDLLEPTFGTWDVHFHAEGATPDKHRFARTGSNSFVAERGIARLGETSVTLTEMTVRVHADVDVKEPGTYRLDIVAARRETAVAWAQEDRELAAGAASWDVEIPRTLVESTRDLQFDIRLVGVDPIGVAGRVVLPLKE
jgi:hypothetical protein